MEKMVIWGFKSGETECHVKLAIINDSAAGNGFKNTMNRASCGEAVENKFIIEENL